MKLINDLYEVIDNSCNETGFITTIKLNPRHIVYSGHFPGHPITPGVIQMQIIHELLEKNIGRNLRLTAVNQCKFLKILNPEEISHIVIYIEFTRTNELLHINGSGEYGTEIFFKLNAIYQFK